MSLIKLSDPKDKTLKPTDKPLRVFRLSRLPGHIPQESVMSETLVHSEVHSEHLERKATLILEGDKQEAKLTERVLRFDYLVERVLAKQWPEAGTQLSSDDYISLVNAGCRGLLEADQKFQGATKEEVRASNQEAFADGKITEGELLQREARGHRPTSFPTFARTYIKWRMKDWWRKYKSRPVKFTPWYPGMLGEAEPEALPHLDDEYYHLQDQDRLARRRYQRGLAEVLERSLRLLPFRESLIIRLYCGHTEYGDLLKWGEIAERMFQAFPDPCFIMKDGRRNHNRAQSEFRKACRALTPHLIHISEEKGVALFHQSPFAEELADYEEITVGFLEDLARESAGG